MKELKVVGLSFLFCVFLSFYAFAEELTLTTYYPAPYGVYREMEVHDNLSFKDPAGGGTELITKTDDNANLHLDAPTETDFHIIFDNVTEGASVVDRPFCYLLRYTTGASPTYCADNYVSANFLKDSKLPADPTNLPGSGYVVCIRGWE